MDVHSKSPVHDTHVTGNKGNWFRSVLRQRSDAVCYKPEMTHLLSEINTVKTQNINKCLRSEVKGREEHQKQQLVLVSPKAEASSLTYSSLYQLQSQRSCPLSFSHWRAHVRTYLPLVTLRVTSVMTSWPQLAEKCFCDSFPLQRRESTDTRRICWNGKIGNWKRHLDLCLTCHGSVFCRRLFMKWVFDPNTPILWSSCPLTAVTEKQPGSSHQHNEALFNSFGPPSCPMMTCPHMSVCCCMNQPGMYLSSLKLGGKLLGLSFQHVSQPVSISYGSELSSSRSWRLSEALQHEEL